MSGRDPAAAAVDPVARAGLVVAIALPLMAVVVGGDDGGVTFVLYREAKLVALSVSGWALLSLLLWRQREAFPGGELVAVAASPVWWSLAGLSALGALSLSWAAVPANGVYELRQWALLLPLLLVLAAWIRNAPWVGSTVISAVTGVGAALTLGGLLQRWGGLAWLAPINPYGEVAHPLFMGYKNPAALAVVAQLFLLAVVMVEARRRWLRLTVVVVLGVELWYLVSLQSRTSLAALAVGLATLALMAIAGLLPVRRGLAMTAVVAVVAAVVIGLGLVAGTDDGVAAKITSLVDLARSPRSYLDTDRGIYLRNTVSMARSRPLGVGLGDWQTQYPVYRRVGRDVAFDVHVQARRAHSDPVQMLGELGWLGLGLWTTFAVSLVWTAVRTARRRRTIPAVLLAAQVVTVVTATAFDYVVELPSHRFLVILLAAVVLGTASDGGEGGHRWRLRWRLPRWVLALVLVTTCGAATAAAFQLQKIRAEARLNRAYMRCSVRPGGLPRLGDRLDPGQPEVGRLLDLSRTFVSTPGHTKSMYRSYLLAAHVWQMVGRPEVAKQLLQRSLDLHPYHPGSLLLAAELADDPEARAAWRGAAHHVLDTATEGFAIAYPDPIWPPSPSGRGGEAP